MAAHGMPRVVNRALDALVLGGLALSIALASGPAAAQTAPPSDLASRFKHADKNHDGKIDREEYYQMVVDSFYFRDKERKGYLTIEDLREASPEAFKAANRKGDGRLTLEEYINALYIDFDKADTDRDGSLTLEEIQVYVRSSGR